MLEKIKNIGWTGLGLIFIVLMFVLFAFFVKGGVWLFENFHELFQTITNWVWLIALVLIVISVIPRIRMYTGLAIHYLTFIWGVFFWLFCLFVTYQLWGFIGVFVGLAMAGIGVFFTAFLAVLFTGQISGAFLIALNLAIIYGVRSLGFWIATKHRTTTKMPNIDNSPKEPSEELNDGNINY